MTVTDLPTSPSPLLTFHSMNAWLGRMRNETGPDQQLREFYVNGIHGVNAAVAAGMYAAATKPAVKLTRVAAYGTHKLAFCDNGIGMSASDMDRYLGQVMASGGGVAGSRFGVGARIAGLAWNRAGLEYISWNGSDDPVRRVLGFDPATSEPAWLRLTASEGFLADAYTEVLPVAALPEFISAAGHGTMVLLLGDDLGDDTFAFRPTVTGTPRRVKNKEYAYAINTRYWRLPHDTITFAATTIRNQKTATFEDRTSNGDVQGLGALIGRHSDASFQVPVSGALIEVHVLDRDAAHRNGLRDDVLPLGNTVAIVKADGEVEGLDEIYELHSARSGAARLRDLGLGLIGQRCTVAVYPADCQANMARTALVALDGQPLPWADWCDEFKQNHPPELTELIDATVNGSASSSKGRDLLARRLANMPNSFSMKRYAKLFASKHAPVSGHRSGGNGGGSGNGSHGGTGEGPSRRPTQTGGAGPGAGGNANTPTGVTSDGSVEALVAEVDIPKVIEVGNDVLEIEGWPHRVAVWDPQNRVVKFNVDFVGIDAEVDEHLETRKAATAADRAVVRSIVIDRMVTAICESILRIEALQAGTGTVDIDFALTPDALTAAAVTHIPAWPSTKKQISDQIGAA